MPAGNRLTNPNYAIDLLREKFMSAMDGARSRDRQLYEWLIENRPLIVKEYLLHNTIFNPYQQIVIDQYQNILGDAMKINQPKQSIFFKIKSAIKSIFKRIVKPRATPAKSK